MEPWAVEAVALTGRPAGRTHKWRTTRPTTERTSRCVPPPAGLSVGRPFAPFTRPGPFGHRREGLSPSNARRRRHHLSIDRQPGRRCQVPAQSWRDREGFLPPPPVRRRAGWLAAPDPGKKIAGKWLGTFRISARCIRCDLLVSNFKQGGVGHGPMVNC